jgi:hypothetical protein
LHRNLRLDFNHGGPQKLVEHLVSVIKPALLTSLIESKLEMDKSNFKKDILEFVAYLEKMAILFDEHGHVVHNRKTGDPGAKNMAKETTLASKVLDTTLEEAPLEVAVVMRC